GVWNSDRFLGFPHASSIPTEFPFRRFVYLRVRIFSIEFSVFSSGQSLLTPFQSPRSLEKAVIRAPAAAIRALLSGTHRSDHMPCRTPPTRRARTIRADNRNRRI